MITLSRCRARALRTLFRRSVLGIPIRSTAPPLILQADPSVGLRVRCQHGDLAVEQVVHGTFRLAETLAVPVDVLGEVEGRDDSPVAFEATGPGQVTVRWTQRGSSQTRDLVVPDAAGLPAFPDPPDAFVAAPAGLLAALAEAVRTTSDDGRRYALDHVLLRGPAGEVVATDGRQLLIQRVGPLPWDGDVLIRRTPLFESLAQARDQPLQIGRTDDYLMLRLDDLTVWLANATGLRFPRLDGVLPAVNDDVTRLRLDPADAATLTSRLDELPGGDAENVAVTLDLNGRIALRARDDARCVRELVLSRSGYTGPPVRLSTNRMFLGRAAALGFDALQIAGADKPIVARDTARTYAWQPLDPDSALAPTATAVRIESSPSATTSTRPQPTRITMPDPVARNGRPAEPSSPEPVSTGASPGLPDLIREAEALHAALAQAKGQTARLIAGLRGHRKRNRAVAETLRSLRQLGLAEVAE